MLVGIKSSLEKTQLKDRLALNPPLLEIHLLESDFRESKQTKQTITKILKEHPKLLLTIHAPILDNGLTLSISDDNPLLDKLYELALSNERIIGVIMHTEGEKEFNPTQTKKNIMQLHQDYVKAEKKCYYENLPFGRTKTIPLFKSFIKEFGITRVTLDMSHVLAQHNQIELEQLYHWLAEQHIAVYTHISDNKFYSKQSLPMNIGKGDVDFEHMIPLIDFGIIETYSSDETIGKEIKEDYKKFIAMKQARRY